MTEIVKQSARVLLFDSEQRLVLIRRTKPEQKPYVDTSYPDVTEADADPDIDLGDFAVPDHGLGDDGAGVTVVEGQVYVHAGYTAMGGGDKDQMTPGALLMVEELLAATH
ncbi:hypothetical protein [Nocardiopsis sp. MG754419]|uniref:hypothetical protein n=1 Tax=Nocardiopsis sp. MG754419 TaxID=2259865 RepID=UPI0035B16AF1